MDKPEPKHTHDPAPDASTPMPFGALLTVPPADDPAPAAVKPAKANKKA